MILPDALPPELITRVCGTTLTCSDLAHVECTSRFLRALPLKDLWKRLIEAEFMRKDNPPHGNARFRSILPRDESVLAMKQAWRTFEKDLLRLNLTNADLLGGETKWLCRLRFPGRSMEPLQAQWLPQTMPVTFVQDPGTAPSEDGGFLQMGEGPANLQYPPFPYRLEGKTFEAQPHVCALCGLSGATMRCSQCLVVWYCSAQCMEAHHDEHNRVCQDPSWPDHTQSLVCHTFPAMAVSRTVDGEWLIENQNAILMSCGLCIDAELEQIWEVSREVSSQADMTSMDTALATMDMEAVMALDQRALAFEKQKSAQSKTWRYFFHGTYREHTRGGAIPDMRGSLLYQRHLDMRIRDRPAMAGRRRELPFYHFDDEEWDQE